MDPSSGCPECALSAPESNESSFLPHYRNQQYCSCSSVVPKEPHRRPGVHRPTPFTPDPHLLTSRRPVLSAGDLQPPASHAFDITSPKPTGILRSMGSAYQWLTRCIPAFSVCAVAILLVYSFIVSPLGNSHDGAATPPQLILSLYTVFCHILSIVFPIRVCWAIRDVIKRMRAAAMETPHTARRRQRSTHTRKSSGEDPVPLFVCILPAYKEEIATLEETLRVLASHAQASSSYHVRAILQVIVASSLLRPKGIAGEFPN